MTCTVPTYTAIFSWSALALLATATVACDDGRARPTPDAEISLMDGGAADSGDVTRPPDTTGPDGSTTDRDGGPSASREPGSLCSCDSQCAGTAANPGLCVQGICMTRATAACGTAGSRDECGPGSRCWGVEGFEGGICWPDCDAFSCDGTCDDDGSCFYTEASGGACDATCSEVCTGDSGGSTGGGECPPNAHVDGEGCVCDEGFVVNAERTGCVAPCTTASECSRGDICVDGLCEAPPCSAGSCASGLMCAASGDCVVDLGTPPPGPVPTACTIGSRGIPDWRCTSGCTDLVPFTPVTGPGYENYALNGETSSNQYRSFIRRDVMMLVKYATAMVDCQAAGWSFGNRGPLGLGDMSERDGAIPGTSIGDPGHPAGTHVDGADMDIGYYQTGTANNRLRPICEHASGGSDQYHCTSAPTLLEPWRTALFLGHLHINPNLRVIGVDGKAGVLIDSALTQLCSDRWVTTGACSSHKITYEVTDMGRGWYRFHHHHLHISVSRP